jgi:hypothetical protein
MPAMISWGMVRARSVSALSVLLAPLVVGCAEGDDPNAKRPDAVADVPLLEIGGDGAGDTGAGDTGAGDTGAGDTGAGDTGAGDTGAADTKGDAPGDTPGDTPGDGATDSGKDTGADVGTGWRKTITIDGTNDFSATDETFTTTSTGYSAHLTWDAAALYVGYSGADIGLGSGASTSKWVFVYVDADPGAGTGATKTEQYKDQAASFGTGFGAEAYFAWRTDGAFSQLRKHSGGAWSAADATTVTVARSGSFVEMRIPYAALGVTPGKLGVVTLMLNEGVGGAGQWTYAGLYTGSFTDGFYAAPSTAPTKYWLELDLASPTAPSALVLRRP